MIIRWKNIYETGFDHTDQWNKKLIITINEFYKYISGGTLTDNAEKIINLIMVESIAQFSVEKRYFEHYNYSVEEYQNHVDEHEHFINVLRKALQKIRTGDILFCYKVVDFLRSWIINHVLLSDKKFASFSSMVKHEV